MTVGKKSIGEKLLHSLPRYPPYSLTDRFTDHFFIICLFLNGKEKDQDRCPNSEEQYADLEF